MERKFVYIIEHYYNGYDVNGYDDYIETLEDYKIFSSLEKAKKTFKLIMKNEYKSYTKFIKDFDYTNIMTEAILVENEEFLNSLSKNASFDEVSNLIDEEKENGEFPIYWIIKIVCKELDKEIN